MIVARTLIEGVRSHLRTRFAEWVFAAIMGRFASKLLEADETFASSHSYDYMASKATETTWGVALGLVVLIRLLALAINGSVSWFRPWSSWVRAVCSWLCAGAWFALSFGMWRANSAGTGWGTYGILMLAEVSLAIMIPDELDRPSRTPHANS